VKRIINVPKRGIGATTIDNVQAYADERQISFFEALCEADQIMTISRGSAKLTDFVTMIRAFRTKSKTFSLEELLKDVIDVVGYMDYLKTLDDDDDSGDNDRAANVDELISKIAAYEENEEVEQPTLTGFLEEVALVADIDRIGEDNEKVLLMTLHSAKGLEFENVYLAGMEENVFPSYMALQFEDSDPEGIEEERRLAYVGITRAKKNLTLTAARRRMVRGETQYNRLSRFAQEIPDELLDRNKPLTAASFLYEGGETIDDDFDYSSDDDYLDGGYSGIKPAFAKGLAKSASKSSFDNGKSELANTYKLKAKPKPKVTKPRAVPDKPYIAGAGATHAKGQLAGISKGMPMKAETPDYVVGDRVSHVKYGEGTVTGLEQGPRDYKVTVMFDGPGQKVMYAAFAKLKKI
ncbi:MAG: ATP-binding domain-containing protein, partial [Butyrivibrio sp.]|nr:ATP-binding domain-containing protein [Butyrivibrio sp.]